MKMVKLSMIAGFEDATGEDDGLEAREVTKPVILDASQVRNFYARKGDRVGTRILFRNGSALPVQETFEQVEAAFHEVLSGGTHG
jgi:hypothetical protein